MRYLDSGQRDPGQALGTWLQNVMLQDVEEVRWQSGFFAADALGIVQPSLESMARNDRTVRALIGSNDQSTVRRDVERLVALLGIPRRRAQLGVVSYRDGYFHPKTFHVRRADGSQAAYVGSANITGSGVASLHVEAGVTVDSREGDPVEILNEVASAVDFWFDTNPAGLYSVFAENDITRLVADGILAETALPRAVIARPAAAEGDSERPGPGARLRPLIALPRIRELVVETEPEAGEAGRLRSIVLPVAPRDGFPPYLLFAPGLQTPTSGATALSGASLPRGAAGLIIRLNRDSARHFDGRGGTANFSVPVATLTTLRFGRYVGQYPRPRAEFTLRTRYIGQERVIPGAASETNIMAYGYIAGEPGHKDVRMVIPASIRGLAEQIRQAGDQVPADGDVALLEWPTANSASEFRISFLDRRSRLFEQTQNIFREAQNAAETVGVGACWLSTDLSPAW
jgi:hypothetical protein